MEEVEFSDGLRRQLRELLDEGKVKTSGLRERPSRNMKLVAMDKLELILREKICVVRKLAKRKEKFVGKYKREKSQNLERMKHLVRSFS